MPSLIKLYMPLSHQTLHAIVTTYRPYDLLKTSAALLKADCILFSDNHAFDIAPHRCQFLQTLLLMWNV